MNTIKTLLVDDEERFLSTTKLLLSKRECEVFTATNGFDALKILKKQRIDVVVLDVKMPGLDGVSTLSKIKADFPAVEVILLTGHGSIDSALDGMKKGAFEYLLKPCDVDVLRERIDAAFHRKKQTEEKIQKEKIADIISDPWSALDK